MAFWNKKKADFELINSLVNQNPGIRPAQIAKELGISRSTITRRLPSLEDAGFLFSEDDRGGLWPFRRTKN